MKKDGERPRRLSQLVRRPESGAPLRFIEAPPSQWLNTLEVGPEAIEQATDTIAPLWRHFVRGSFTPEQRARMARCTYPGQGSTLRNFAHALRRSKGAVPGQPEQLEACAQKLSRYGQLTSALARATNQAIDFRLILGSLQWYLLRATLQAVVVRLESPECPQAEADLLRRRFSKLLLNKEQLLMNREQRQQHLQQQRQLLEDQVTELEKRALIEDVRQALRRQLPIPDEKLELAARYHAELRHRAAPASTVDPRQSRR